ncbi:hypothetical protein [Proteus faecis]|uniref:hypothetical protein n=1 Tax=Proteus faecis TaxID=2050967 RepID=UPI0021BA75D9|nr:hypothetical protein [Proteus faecis]MCT8248989.1 hypothetical protein [Proteus faecis]
MPISNQKINEKQIQKSVEPISRFHNLSTFFIYLRDCIKQISNANHKFTCLNNRSVPEYNLDKMVKEIPNIFNEIIEKHKSKKTGKLYEIDENNKVTTTEINNHEDAEHYKIKKSIQYNPYYAHILPNFTDIYSSKNIDAEMLITQLINYIKDKKSDVNKLKFSVTKNEIVEELINNIKSKPIFIANDEVSKNIKNKDNFINLAQLIIELKNNITLSL